MQPRLIAVFTVLLTVHALSVSHAQILDLRQLTADELRKLPPERTAVVIPGGILEEHGPYLPSYTDGYVNEYLAARLAEAIVARPGWVVLMFPPIPLGAGGFNQVGLKQAFPGTYHIHMSTLRAVFMDIASEIGEAGFKWIFVVHGHGAPEHNIALHQAADFFSDTYNGRMAHLANLVDPAPGPNLPLLFSGSALEENGLGVHSDANETSRILFVRGDLVRSEYQQATPMARRTWSELVELGSRGDFKGYVGSPRLATAALGAESIRRSAERYASMALRILDGLDPRTLGRAVDMDLTDPGVRRYNDAAREHDRRIQEVQQRWLASKGGK